MALSFSVWRWFLVQGCFVVHRSLSDVTSKPVRFRRGFSLTWLATLPRPFSCSPTPFLFVTGLRSGVRVPRALITGHYVDQERLSIPHFPAPDITKEEEDALWEMYEDTLNSSFILINSRDEACLHLLPEHSWWPLRPTLISIYRK